VRDDPSARPVVDGHALERGVRDEPDARPPHLLEPREHELPVEEAYTLLALYRSVTLRSDEGRSTRWKALLQSVRDVLIAAAEKQLAGLRPARRRRRHTLKSPGSYLRRATSKGPETGGGRGRRRPAAAAACLDVQPINRSGAPDGGA